MLDEVIRSEQIAVLGLRGLSRGKKESGDDGGE